MTSPSDATEHDHAVERLVGGVLRAGVVVAAVVVLAGIGLMLLRGVAAPTTFTTFRPDASSLRSLGGIRHGVRALDGGAVVQLGLVLLIATPVARVALTLVAFLRGGDRLYVALTMVVLVLLLYGLLHGG